MGQAAASIVPLGSRITAERYFALVDEGVLAPDDRVELLEGVIVAMSPQNPRHAAAVSRANRVLTRVAGRRAAVRVQMPLVLGTHSVPEPDLAIVPGHESDYDRAHPTAALLVVEVADTSLVQDRLTKVPMYAAGGVPEVWVVNLRDDCIDVFRDPDSRRRRFKSTSRVAAGGELKPLLFSRARIRATEILPR